MYKTKKRLKKKPNAKEIVHAHSIAITKRRFFKHRRVYSTLNVLHCGCAVIITGLSPSRPRFNPKPVHMGFVVDKVALAGRGPPLPQITLVSPSLSFHQLFINP
jgi:ethanolamine utilization protein EutP (predicted NTPase)